MKKLLILLSIALFISIQFFTVQTTIAAEDGGIFGGGLLKAGEVDYSTQEVTTGSIEQPTASILSGGDGSIVGSMLKSIISFLITAAISISTLLVVYGGFQYIYGSLTGQETGKKTITYALIGLIISLLAYTITTAFSQFFGA